MDNFTVVILIVFAGAILFATLLPWFFSWQKSDRPKGFLLKYTLIILGLTLLALVIFALAKWARG